MSKLKLMYDVISILKEKEVISGIFQAEAKKDQLQLVSFTNEFEKNLSSGETKVKISTELDCDGKKVKHESQTEFTMQDCCAGHRHHGFMKHMHHTHHDNGQNNGDLKCGGFKGKLTKLAFVLSIFNQIKVDEKEDKSVFLSLSLNDIPDDIKKTFQERCSQGKMSEHHQHHGCIKEFCALKDPKIEVKVWIKKTREVEKLVVTVDGKQVNELNENHDMSLLAELRLT
ncbi:hypothetical protein [Desulfosporosinus sp. BICA1-9]|uniref:hypothetical protein n=1 Tax=Desulfosporosinus sp. BICA1-9 TaxID=1531958 RepID=UPI00054B3FD5|nr:hypothetical protein [Desulfosporosinus sp. BICA1-9]KJS48297.1 MAG: hypothetical protein VR66_14690 [Peptococcaceae bacterium BRH_c23]KJS84910.1 MAG: hypothetical protein JL57_19995 [Desulfosporosinus sp. BICA1-9]HBW38994.1 hypothetical protein [Desulfosporosinus sp.]